MDAKKDIQTIDEYIQGFSNDVQNVLKKMRQAIRKAVPEAEETISYRMPAFTLNGERLIYFAAFKKHIGVYPPPPKAFKKEASPYAGPKGSLQFPLDIPMPLDLVQRIVQHKAKEILKSGKKTT